MEKEIVRKDEVCFHIWQVKEWLQISETIDNTTIERRNVTKLYCPKCFTIRKLNDKELINYGKT